MENLMDGKQSSVRPLYYVVPCKLYFIIIKNKMKTTTQENLYKKTAVPELVQQFYIYLVCQ